MCQIYWYLIGKDYYKLRRDIVSGGLKYETLKRPSKQIPARTRTGLWGHTYYTKCFLPVTTVNKKEATCTI